MHEHQAEAEPLVLVVEDEVLIRIAAADHLRHCGFKVAEASNAIEAQELILAGLKVDLVFSDITMPGQIDGIALAQWVHEQLPSVPVVLTSGVTSSLEEARQACRNVHSYTPKPYGYDGIVASIRAALAARG